MFLGKIRVFPNPFLPPRHHGEVTVLTVGITGHKRDMVAVIEHSNGIEGKIKVKFVFIKYRNPFLFKYCSNFVSEIKRIGTCRGTQQKCLFLLQVYIQRSSTY